MSTPQPQPTATRLMTLRTLVLLVVGLLAAAAAGYLTYVSTKSSATATLSAAGTFAATVKLLHELVE